MPSSGRAAVALLLVGVLAVTGRAQSSPAAEYKSLLAREEKVRAELAAATAATRTAVSRRARALVSDYEDMARRHPTSGYSDNALWQGGLLSGEIFRQSGQAADRQTARRLLQGIADRFPSSSLVKQVPEAIARMDRTAREQAKPSTSKPAAAPASRPAAASASKPAGTSTSKPGGTSTSPAAPSPADTQPTLTDIRRELLPEGVRVTLALDGETAFTTTTLDGPARVVVDLMDTRTLHSLRDANLLFSEDVVRQIRVGRQADNRTRVVLDLTGTARSSVYPVYNPYRLVIDLERPAGELAAARARPASAPAATQTTGQPAPAAPSTNTNGSFSLSRQLGLGISRIVIDPGHGGHDPGAKSNGLTEADLALDVALRLEKRLHKQPGVEVLLTRRTNVYIPLEERTAIANRAGADLFLSVHANASENTSARGIETYFLNFAPDAAAEAIAARENAGSSRTMRNLPEIVRAIALNDKVDESRDFAGLVQDRLYQGLKKANRQARDLGVKHAPFQVLIGAAMPSILVEISFITNRQEASLLKTDSYRDQIAEALLNGVMAYQGAVKKGEKVAKK